MRKNALQLVFLLAATAICSFAQKAEPAGAPPSELGATAATLQKAGTKVYGTNGNVFCEVWFRDAIPMGAPNNEESATFANVAQGTLLGAIRFPEQGSDRRGQVIKPGVYTLRYSTFPITGDHQGVAPQRDFALLTPAADDKDPKAMPDFKTLVEWSKKASGTPHPAVFSIWKQEPGDFKAGFAQMGDHDWVLQVKSGDTLLAIILIGRAEG